MDLQEIVYEDYTQLFYANMIANQKAKDINIFIRGCGHILNATLLNEILGVPNAKDCITRTHCALCIKGYKAKKWMKKFTEGKTCSLPFGNILDKNHKVLYYFILEVFCLKSGTKSNVGNVKAFLLWAIENFHYINQMLLVHQENDLYFV